MDEFLDDEMKEKLRRLVAQFGRPLTEPEKRKWLYGIDDDASSPDVGVDDMLRLMTGHATSLAQANQLADEMGISAENAHTLQTYYQQNKYARQDMDTNWRTLDYLERKTGLPRSEIAKILKTLRLRD